MNPKIHKQLKYNFEMIWLYKTILSFCLLFFILIPHSNAGNRDTLRSSGEWAYTENKGQWESQILYKARLHEGALFLEKQGYTVVVEDAAAIHKLMEYKFSDEAKINKDVPLDRKINCHAYNVSFENSNPNPSIQSFNPSSDYQNYYIGNDKSKWASNVRAYNQIKYSNIYDGIDWIVYSQDSKFKYDFNIASGKSIDLIKMKYNGVNKLSISKGNLLIETSINTLSELKPYAYQVVNGIEKPVECNFILKGNIVSFDCPNYDKSLPLTIDPVLIFCSFSGSQADNWGYTATYDQHGFLYAGGSVFGVGYPVTTGAFQITYGMGNSDISISKFDSSGVNLIYSTYVGGNGSEVPNSLIVNNNNELYMLATTGSANFPTTTGCYDNSFNGGTNYTLTYVIGYPSGSDIALCKFSANGNQLLGSTFLGGSGNDGLNTVAVLKKNYADDVRGEIMIDANSNVYVVSSTTSTDFPTNANSVQPTQGGGIQDGCVFKMNHNLTNLIWSTYLGGNGNDACYSIQLDIDDNVYVAGGTTSTNFPTTPNVIQPTFGGVVDGFITLINQNGNNIIASTYYGSSVYDQIYLTKTNKKNYVYVIGQTNAPGNTFIYNAVWNKPGGGQFLSKFTPNLQTKIWSTAFGSSTNTAGTPDISPTALLVDLCNNIYISGWGSPSLNSFGGTTGMPITPDAFQSTTDNNDYYFLVITDDASAIVYGSYFGGGVSREHVDGGTSRFDKKGRIYQAICAGCGNNDDLPVSPGAWSQTNNSTNCNMGVVKFDFNLPAVIADFVIPSIVCAPISINFQNTSQTIPNGTTVWSWNFGDNTTSNQQNPSHTYTQSGVYDITLIVRNIGSCNSADTITKQLIVLSNTKDTLPEKHICLGDFVQIGVPPSGNASIVYIWSPSGGLNNTSISNPIANPTTTTNYMLRVSDGVCTDTLMQKVNVYNIQVDAGNNITVCIGDTATLTATNSGGANRFIWSSNANFSDTLNSNLLSNVFKPVINQSATYYIKATNGFCYAYDSVTVFTSYADISATSNYTICQGDTVQLSATNLITGQTVNYSWLPATGIVSGGTSATPHVNPSTTTTYVVTGTNSFGCKDTAVVLVTVNSVLSTNQVVNARCFGLCDGSIQLNPYGGSAPYSYHWAHIPGNYQTLSSLCADDYSVTISDNIGCKKIQQFTIQQPSQLVINFTDTMQVLCNGACNGTVRAVAGGGVPNYSYQWINGINIDFATGLCAGIYTVTVTDQNQCTVSSQFRIMDTSTFDATGSAVAARCFGECNGIATVVASSGLPPYTYHWDIGNDSTTFHNLCANTYSVTVSDANTCIRNVFITVPEPAALVIDSIYLRNPLCNGSCNGIINIFPIGGTSPYTYTWNGTNGGSFAENLCSGTYQIIIRDANGCEIDTTIILTQPDPLEVNIVTTKVPCGEACIGSAYATITGGTPQYYYYWSNGPAQVTEVHDLCKGNYMITVSDYNNCHAMAQFSILDSSLFPITGIDAWSDKDTIYESQSVQLHSTVLSDFTYHWSPGSSLNNPNIPNPLATPGSSTIYVVTVSDVNGCILTDTVRIIVLDVVCDEPFVYVPNAFTPNADGNNDVLFVRSEIVTDVIFAIYDRWGEKIFETTNLNKGWDGTYKGVKSDPGVFVYYLDATCINKEKYIKKGNVTLIR